jgi:hypothetical protein
MFQAIFFFILSHPDLFCFHFFFSTAQQNKKKMTRQIYFHVYNKTKPEDLKNNNKKKIYVTGICVLCEI